MYYATGHEETREDGVCENMILYHTWGGGWGRAKYDDDLIWNKSYRNLFKMTTLGALWSGLEFKQGQ